VSRVPSLVALGTLSPLLLYSLLAAGPVEVERTLYLMGTRATLAVHAPDRVAALNQLDRMVRRLEQSEATLSTWRENTELGRLNRQPVGDPFEVGQDVCALWAILTRWHVETDGAFDPAVGALIEAWGLRDGGRRPSEAELLTARAVSGFHHFAFNSETGACRVTRLADVTLDAGAFGKGEALRRLQADGESNFPWWVDLGGQVAVSAATRHSEGWPFAIADPARRSQPAMDIVLIEGSLATSGASERSFSVDGERIAHILDPRSGDALYRPESVTVWHQDPLVADLLSTALYVLGPEDGVHFAEARDLAALFLAPSTEATGNGLTARATVAFERRFPRATEQVNDRLGMPVQRGPN
jgi:thiamine biosynthesis lipoprotein|tara:strand:+ start:549 stop:1619 length:1071 start_codon:yes stop_codon:yes gene_type:complete